MNQSVQCRSQLLVHCIGTKALRRQINQIVAGKHARILVFVGRRYTLHILRQILNFFGIRIGNQLVKIDGKHMRRCVQNRLCLRFLRQGSIPSRYIAFHDWRGVVSARGDQIVTAIAVPRLQRIIPSREGIAK